MNVLLLGGAKRVSMARMMLRAAQARGIDCKIYSYEISTHVPISAVGTVIVGKRWDDSAIYDDLLRISQAHGIGIIIPFVDGAVAVAAKMAAMHPGSIFAPTCEAETAEVMFDKACAAETFARHGLPIPATYTGGPVSGPLIAKPRHGSASKGIVAIDSDGDLAKIAAHRDEYLIQERIDHREEYTVDCYVSVNGGQIAAIVPRRRIEVSGGEVTHTETVLCPEAHDLARLTLERLRLRGAVTIQILHDTDTGRYMLMEINPRLGGGAVCAVHAMVDLPGLILDDAAGKPLQYICYRPNTEIVRYQQEVVFFN